MYLKVLLPILLLIAPFAHAAAAPAKPLPARLPIPAQADLARSRKFLSQAFAKELADTSVTGRRALAGALLNQAAEIADVPADRYALLTAAFDASRDAGDFYRCAAIADQLGKVFEIDAQKLKIDAGQKISFRADAAATALNVRAGLRVIDELIASDEVDPALQLYESLSAESGEDMAAPLLAQRGNDLTAIKAARDKMRQADVLLRTEPLDSAANLAGGTYRCFFRHDWHDGLPMLAKSSDSALKDFAAAELNANNDAKAIAQAADNWWNYGPQQPALIRAGIIQHAIELYQSALPKIAGLQKTLIEKRIAAPPAPEGPRVIDLLRMVSLANDRVEGDWEFRGDVLYSKSLRANAARIQFPYEPPAEYDFRAVVTRTAGNDANALICAAPGTQFEWWIGGWENKVCGLGLINGKIPQQNPTGKTAEAWLTNGQRFITMVKVRKTGIEAYLNGRLITSWKTDFKNVSVLDRLPQTTTIGILFHFNDAQIELADVLEVSGNGRAIR